MKKCLILTAFLLTFAMPTIVWGQNTPAVPAPPSGPPAGGSTSGGHNGGPGGQEGGQADEAKRFQEHKTEILRRINQHLEEIENRKHCVEAANDHQELRACMPQGGDGHGGDQNGNGSRHGPPPEGGQGGEHGDEQNNDHP